ncbi:hypothetical protein [Photobacterium galatheae]|uniref:Uncharacterized protein n=1 Tax=Photobacterium galatheae TaxID=1654360 RepID=A0A066RII8_9GAMM|nr:hypothetical protein [Photobacterium galatheae]KDM90240.1 hypothetical protein EA58_18170 [Photobacterium galatheae]MCM0151497.1 hypothetical protein [Photobacterium galatheae]
MTQRKLTVHIPQENLSDLFHQQLNIVLVQSISVEGNSNNTYVAWSVTLPAENKVFTWEDCCELYVSPVPNDNGCVISAFSKIPCSPGLKYTSEYNGFSPQTETISSSEYGVSNRNSQAQLTFGLFQSVSVDGNSALTSPVNAVTVPRNLNTLFSEPENVYILLASNLVSGEIFYLPDLEVDLMSALALTYDECLAFCSQTSDFVALNASTYFTDERTHRVYSRATLLDFSQTNQIQVQYFSELGKFVVMS